MASLNFNAHEVEPNEAFVPVPNGDYLCVVAKSEMKPTKAGDGAYLELQLEILDGPYKGRKLWDRLNLSNPNATTVKIARGALSSLCRAVGVMQPRDSGELHGLPFVAKVAVVKRSDSDELTNVVKSYRKRDASPPAAAGGGGRPVGAAPWKRPAPAPAAPAATEVPF